MPSKNENAMQVARAAHVLDAKDQILGRLAVQAADLLRGKHKISFESHLDGGDYVTIINAAEIKVTGTKLENKIYSRHSNHPGGLKEEQLKTVLERDPALVLERAIAGMLPKNRLRPIWLRRLKIYAGEATK